ncbi:hypothetical protein WJX72_000933 [[Myrmecia] bisecta]|uniref:Uncharacterized protein n=1 Tax=[Myrmecia] bisecta TaxID=41462 RepID=A0AAW1R534_9CHLO
MPTTRQRRKAAPSSLNEDALTKQTWLEAAQRTKQAQPGKAAASGTAAGAGPSQGHTREGQAGRLKSVDCTPLMTRLFPNVSGGKGFSMMAACQAILGPFSALAAHQVQRHSRKLCSVAQQVVV